MTESLMDALNQQFKQLRILRFIYLIAAVLALALFFVDRRLTLVLLAASLLLHLVLVRPRSKAYQQAFVHACTQFTLAHHLDNPRHATEPVLTVDTLRSARLIPENGASASITLHEGGSGTRKGRPVKLGDAVFCNSFPMNGKTRHEFVTGCWIQIQLDKDSGLDWRLIDKQAILPQSLYDMQSRNKDLIGPDDPLPDWTKNAFLVLHKKDTPPLPPDHVLNALKKMVKSNQTPLTICIQGDSLHVFIPNRILGQSVSVRYAPPESLPNLDILPELADIAVLADALSA